jgi:hypothetical protein
VSLARERRRVSENSGERGKVWVALVVVLALL